MTVNFSSVFFFKQTLEDLAAFWSAEDICAKEIARGISDLSMAFQEKVAAHLRGGHLREYLEGAGGLLNVLSKFDSDKSRSSVMAEAIHNSEKNIRAETRIYFSQEVRQVLRCVPLRLPSMTTSPITLEMLDKMGQISGSEFLIRMWMETYPKLFEMVEANILWQSEDNPLNQYTESVFLKLKHECAVPMDNMPHASALCFAPFKRKRACSSASASASAAAAAAAAADNDFDAADAEDDKAAEDALREFPDLLAKLTFQRWLHTMKCVGQNFGCQNGAVLFVTLAFAQSCYLKGRYEDSLAYLMQALEFSVSRQLSVRVQKIKLEIYLLLVKVFSRLHLPPQKTSLLCLASALHHSVQDNVQILLAGQTICHGYGWFDIEGFLYHRLDELKEPQTSFFKFKSRMIHCESLLELAENCLLSSLARRLFHSGCELRNGMDANDSCAWMAGKHLRRLSVTLLETRAAFIDRKWMGTWEILMEKTVLLQLIIDGLTNKNIRSRKLMDKVNTFAVVPSREPLLDAFYAFFRGTTTSTSMYVFQVRNEIEIQTRERHLENSVWKSKTLAFQFLISLAVSFDEGTATLGQAWIDEACSIAHRHLPGYYRIGLLQFVRDVCLGKMSCIENVEEKSDDAGEVIVIKTIHKTWPQVNIARKEDVKEIMALLDNPAVSHLHDDVLLRRLAQDCDVREALFRYERRRPAVARVLRQQ